MTAPQPTPAAEGGVTSAVSRNLRARFLRVLDSGISQGHISHSEAMDLLTIVESAPTQPHVGAK